MTAVPLVLRRGRRAVSHQAVATVTALVLLAATAAFAFRPRSEAASPTVTPATVAFVVALRAVETSDVTLADQAAAQASDPAVRAAAATLTVDGDAVAGGLWGLLDRWGVPGAERLPAPGTGITQVLHHDCTVYVNDELTRLATLSGPAFDRRFIADWTAHATTALDSLEAAPWHGAGQPALSAPGLRPLVAEAVGGLRGDLAVVSALP